MSEVKLPLDRTFRAICEGIVSVFDFTGLSWPIDTDMDLESLPKPMTPEEIIAASWRVVGENMRQAIEGYGKKHG